MTQRIGSLPFRSSLIFLLLLSVACVSTQTTPEARDAKKDTKITTGLRINNLGQYGALARCIEGDYKPITEGFDCYLAKGQKMQVKVYTKTPVGTPDKAMIYEVTAHNDEKAYICDDKGAIERGYAATFQEVIQNAVTKDIDVCTTVTAAGHNTTRAEFSVVETANGLAVEFKNLGEHWVNTNTFPDTTGLIPVEFDLIPD